ncbi:transcriptional regulator [Clostridium manihotivorum]|uniref:Transcriptional regulator n=1 Tax=Clostridium manihotivorum TaxID=2320868 RepID=A0A3R5U743_9CLOT|nr:transcriptional regulator [Clostridium manihotivorum]
MVEIQVCGTGIGRRCHFKTYTLVINQSRAGVINRTRKGGYYNVN